MNDWAERYQEKVDVHGEDECWEWKAYRTREGYGQLWLNGNATCAHRLAWELANGPIPEGLCVLHHCDNPGCVNPSHLFLGTRIDNNHDRDEKGRTPHGAKNGRARLTREEAREIRRLYESGEYSQRELGERFGVSQQHVSGIARRKHWAWLN